MKILLISPVVDLDNKTIKGLVTPQLTLYRLEGLTPAGQQVKIVDEEVEDLNLNEECDLVGISVLTATAPRAYALAKEFKKKGKTVVMGGVHPTVMPDEALQYADSIVIGEAENVWPTLINDFQQGKLKKKYFGGRPNLEKTIPINYKNNLTRGLFRRFPIMTTRGCPYNCDFCSVSSIYGRKIRHVPIANVIREIAESKAKIFLFLDDNIIGDLVYAKELFTALIPLKIKWTGQATISLANDPELLQLAAKSGCKGIFIGLESITDYQRQALNKQINELSNLEKALSKIRQTGIFIHASIIFGFDSDTKETFLETVDFLKRNKIGSASFYILTPYPGTKVFAEMKEAGRLLTTNWKYYDIHTVVFKPKNMTPAELQHGAMNARKQFYNISSIIKRFFSHLDKPLMFLAINFTILKQMKKEEKRIAKLDLVNFT